MLEVAAHTQLLERQARIKNEEPSDASFLPLSLTIACLLRQLPVGLAPPPETLSLHQIDRLPLPVLEQRIADLLLRDSNIQAYNGGRALDFLRSIVMYVKTARAMLATCHDHLRNHLTTKETVHALVDCVTATLGEDMVDDDRESDQQGEEFGEDNIVISGEDEGEEPETSRHYRKPASHKIRHESLRRVITRPVPPPAPTMKHTPHVHTRSVALAAVDPSGIVKRAIARDIGDGSAIVGIMQKYPDDIRVQTHGVRALKSAIRRIPSQQPTGKQSVDGKNDGCNTKVQVDVDAETQINELVQDEVKRRLEMLQLVLSNMRKFPDNSSLQQEALFCLLEYAGHADDHIRTIASLGGIVSIMEAMARLPDDEEAQTAALSILGHPVLAEESVLRVDPESRRLVLSAMRRFPLSERLQGLACLALANLSLRQDDSMREIVARGGLELVVAAMTRFSDVGLIQAAGCWLLATVSSKDDEMLAACLDAGGLPPSERARVRFASDPRVQQHAQLAIESLERDAPRDERSTEQCHIQ